MLAAKALSLLRIVVLLLSLVLLFNCISAQEKNPLKYQDNYKLNIKKATGTILVDGELNEPVWQTNSVAKGFWLHFPVDTDSAKRKTEVRMLYDDQFIYVAVTAYDSNHYVIQTLKRDIRPFDSDGFGIVIDPVNQRTNGFLFLVNPYNVQSEDLLSANSFGDLNFSWDNKWYSATKRYDDRWTAEIAIPFKTLRYDATKTQWGINFMRADLKNNEYSTWTRFPVNFNFYDFGYNGSLVWDQPPPKAGTNISFIPYITGSVSRDKENGEPTKGKFSGGFDSKIGLSSSLNLDLTVNPDFSQVEVDQQVTNLTRFDIFFPERRTFFLENGDLFSAYGINPIRPFYSRTIGLDKDGNTIPIIGGARLTGNLTRKLRVGLMNIQTLEKGDFPSQNYTAVSFNQSVQSRSLISGYFLNREGFLNDQQKLQHPLDRFGRNAGIQYAFTDKAGKWQAWAAYHASFKPEIKKENHYIEAGGGYFARKFTTLFDFGDVTTDYYADMGFISRIENHDALKDSTFRLGFKQFYNETDLKFYPKGKKVSQYRVSLETLITLNPDNSFNERNNNLKYLVFFQNTATLQISTSNVATDLKYYTDFTDKKYPPLPPGKYNYTQGKINYITDGRKKFYLQGGIQYGGFYNGKLLQLTASLNFRAQPWGNFALNFENDDIRFPNPYGKTKLFLVSPRIEINFSNSLFWTTFLQYNTQENNFNINSRFQWRFKPMSDLYLVYTDNYFTDPLLKNKSRAIVFKLNYWLNL